MGFMGLMGLMGRMVGGYGAASSFGRGVEAGDDFLAFGAVFRNDLGGAADVAALVPGG